MTQKMFLALVWVLALLFGAKLIVAALSTMSPLALLLVLILFARR